jgi:hydroxymethylbilane synthase
VRGVEGALLAGEAEIGVHSAKDLPAEMSDGLVIAAVPKREDPSDVWIAKLATSSHVRREDRHEGSALDDVPANARVGTASLRRRAQLLAARPDLRVSDLHGNVDTRLRKLSGGELDAIVLAGAGLRRLGRGGEASFSIPAETMTPAAGQGALVLQARVDDQDSISAAAEIGDEIALRELTAERAAVALLEATCATPIGVHAQMGGPGGSGRPGSGDTAQATGARSSMVADGAASKDGSILVEGFVGLPDGSEWLRDRVEGDAEEPAATGALLAERLLAAGARELLDRAEEMASL